MLQLVADENFNNNISRGVLRRKPDADIVRIQDVGLSGVDERGIGIVSDFAGLQSRDLKRYVGSETVTSL